MRMTDRGRETRAGKRKTTINRRRTKDAAKKLPKRCDTYPRILWPTEVKLKLPTKPDEGDKATVAQWLAQQDKELKIVAFKRFTLVAE